MNLFDFPEEFKEWNGFLTAKDKYIDKDELHALTIGLLTGFIGGVTHFAAIFSIVTSGKKLSGHLKDVKKEFAYTGGGFMAMEALQYLYQAVV